MEKVEESVRPKDSRQKDMRFQPSTSSRRTELEEEMINNNETRGNEQENAIEDKDLKRALYNFMKFQVEKEQSERRSRKRRRDEDQRRYHRSHSRRYRDDRSSSRGCSRGSSIEDHGRRDGNVFYYSRDASIENA